MPGFGLGFVPAFLRGRAGVGVGTISSLTALNGSGGAFDAPLLVTDSEGDGFTVTRTVIDGDGNSFNVS